MISGLLMIVKISILHFPMRIYGLNPELIGISSGQSRAWTGDTRLFRRLVILKNFYPH